MSRRRLRRKLTAAQKEKQRKELLKRERERALWWPTQKQVADGYAQAKDGMKRMIVDGFISPNEDIELQLSFNNMLSSTSFWKLHSTGKSAGLTLYLTRRAKEWKNHL